ncbi:MAG TPA: ABC transporter substrate-binding protein [Candidatus Dormibacteraeota bacterium]|jgi:peptide/nickel transport system substrate-binding protein|nr:ABC transporter substrate-binding protein [Candidatus Dormibacteraeota bacterium]
MDERISRRHALQAGLGVGGAALLGTGLSSILAACGGSPSGTSGTGGGSAPKKFNFGLDNNVTHLDPGNMGLLAEFQVGVALYDQLIWSIPDSGNTSFLPGLATSWTPSNGGATYTFKLRKDVKFHDGSSFNADAVKFNFDRIISGKLGSASFLENYSHTNVVDDSTAEVNFSQPNASFLNNLTIPPLGIVSPAAVKKYGSGFNLHPVGSGPFSFVSFTSGEQVVLARNPDYKWGPSVLGLAGPARIQQLTFRIIEESATQASALQTGELNVAYDLDTADVVSLTKGGSYVKDIRSIPGEPVGFTFNIKKAPTDELAVRQAVSYGTNKPALIKTLYNDLYEPAYSVMSSTTPGYDSTEFYPYNPAKAKSLLDSAGWAMGSGGVREKNGVKLSLSWLMPIGFGNPQPLAELIAAQLQQIGVASSIAAAASPGVFTEIDDYVMNLSYVFYQNPDPSFLNLRYACAALKGGNVADYCTTSMDGMLNAANANTNATARYAEYKKIQQILMAQDAIMLPIFNNAASFVYSKSLKGLRYNNIQLAMFNAI